MNPEACGCGPAAPWYIVVPFVALVWAGVVMLILFGADIARDLWRDWRRGR